MQHTLSYATFLSACFECSIYHNHLGTVGADDERNQYQRVSSLPMTPPIIASYSDFVPIRYVQSFCIGLNLLAVTCESVQMTALTTFVHSQPFPFPTDFFPVYFQACMGASPVLSGIYILSLCAFAPAAIFAGLSVKVTGRYRPQMWIAWVIVLVAMGLLSGSTTYGIGTSTGYLVTLGLGSGYVPYLFIHPSCIVHLDFLSSRDYGY